MTKADLEILSRFEEIWERVQSGNSGCAAESGAGLREELLQGLYVLWQGYGCMAETACGSMKQSLQKLSKAAHQAVRLLQTEYFLDTGDLFVFDNDENFASCTMSNLRKLWQSTVAMRTLISDSDAAEEAVYAEIRHLLELQAEVLKKLICSAIS